MVPRSIVQSLKGFEHRAATATGRAGCGRESEGAAAICKEEQCVKALRPDHDLRPEGYGDRVYPARPTGLR